MQLAYSTNFPVWTQSVASKLNSTAPSVTLRSCPSATAREHVVPGIARNGRRSRHRRWHLGGRSKHRCWRWGWGRRKLRWRRGTELCRWCTKLVYGCSWLTSVLGRHARHTSEDPVAVSRPLIDRAHLRGGCPKLARRCCCLYRTMPCGSQVKGPWRPAAEGRLAKQAHRALSTTRATRSFWQGKAQAHAPVETRQLP